MPLVETVAARWPFGVSDIFSAVYGMISWFCYLLVPLSALVPIGFRCVLSYDIGF
jgi:hypothetical protein